MRVFVLAAMASMLAQAGFAQDHLSKQNARLRMKFLSHGVRPLFTLEHKSFSKEKTQLGKLLYFDKILSGNKNISCSTCHHNHFSSGDELPLSLGEGSVGLGRSRELLDGHLVPRNAPPVFNRGFEAYRTLMWDGRIRRDTINKTWITPDDGLNGVSPTFSKVVEPLESLLAVQALFPISSEHEMLGAFQINEVSMEKERDYMWMKLRDRILSIDRYVVLLKAAYPHIQNKDEFTFGHIANAIGAFEAEAFRADRSPFDYFLAGQKKLNKRELKGAQLFLNKGRCIECHSGTLLSDFDFHALAVPQMGPGKDEAINDRGLELISGQVTDRYKFKTPSLRNVELTGPWMHDGYFTNLKEVIKHHLKPQQSLEKHISAPNHQKHKKIFIESLDRDEHRNHERVSLLSPILSQMPTFSNDEVHDLYLFLKTLTDRSFKDRFKAPTSVPSGIQVDKK